MHADSMPIKSTMPGYPRVEIVATTKSESASIIRAIKFSFPLRGPAVSADQLHEHAGVVSLPNNAAFAHCRSDESLVLRVAYWNHQSPPQRELRDERFGHFGAGRRDQYRIVRSVLAPSDGSVEPLHRSVIAAQFSDISLSRASQVA